MGIKYMAQEERKYSFRQSRQIATQTGLIGYFRAHFGEDDEFIENFDEHSHVLATFDFKRELKLIINSLRYGPMYIDKNNVVIKDSDILLFDDGRSEQVWTLETGVKGYSVSNPDYLKNHPNTDEVYTPLTAVPVGINLRKVKDAKVVGLVKLDFQNESGIGAILENREALKKFCSDTPDASFGNQKEWGIRVDTTEHSYFMRLNPHEGEYSVFCCCYVREWLNQHIEAAEKGIRFVSSLGEDLFLLQDGDQIRVRKSDGGEASDITVRYIDKYHFELGDVFAFRTVYHISEFAEVCAKQGVVAIPLRSSLPDTCYIYDEYNDSVGLIEKGLSGYRTGITIPNGKAKNEWVREQNEKASVSRSQLFAMFAGCQFGWASPEADPQNYNEQGF